MPNLRQPAKLLPDTTGSITIIASVFFSIAISAAALAVDMGSLYEQRRQLQGDVDLAALAAANDLGNMDAAARAALVANGIVAPASLVVEAGQYLDDTNISVAQRFVAGQQPYNAVRVSLNEPGKTFFERAITQQSFDIEVDAIAETNQQGTFSIGSRLLAIRGGVESAIAGPLLGSNVSITAMDYESLASAQIQMFGFLDALATNVNLQGPTYDNILNTSVSIGDILAAEATETDAGGNVAASRALRGFASQLNSLSRKIKLAPLINLGPFAYASVGSLSPGYGGTFSALDILMGAAAIANGTNQVSVDLGAVVPGVLSVKLDVAIGERPQYASCTAIGGNGARAATAQTRIRLVADITGGSSLGGANIHLPLYIEIAPAEARFVQANCPAGNTGTATIAAESGIAELWLGDVTNSGLTGFATDPTVRQAQLLSTPLLTINGTAHVVEGNTAEDLLTFSQADVDNATIKRTDTTQFIGPLVGSLLGNLQLEAQASGVSVATPPALGQAIAAQLQLVATPLDDIVSQTLQTLGVNVGEADVRLNNLVCSSGVLAG